MLINQSPNSSGQLYCICPASGILITTRKLVQNFCQHQVPYGLLEDFLGGVPPQRQALPIEVAEAVMALPEPVGATSAPVKRLALLTGSEDGGGTERSQWDWLIQKNDQLLLMEKILHQLIGSSSHYLQGFIYIPGGAGFLPSTVSSNCGVPVEMLQRFWCPVFGKTLLSHVFLLFCWAITSWELKQTWQNFTGSPMEASAFGKMDVVSISLVVTRELWPFCNRKGPVFCCIGLVKDGMFVSFCT